MKNLNECPAVLRFGKVASYNSTLHAATVYFPDLGVVSALLPILTRKSRTAFMESPLTPGEHVACILLGNGSESGLILGAIFDRKNTPPIHDDNVMALTFSNGSKITYDFAKHTLLVDCAGDVVVKAKGKVTLSNVSAINGTEEVSFTAPKINITADDIDMTGMIRYFEKEGAR